MPCGSVACSWGVTPNPRARSILVLTVFRCQSVCDWRRIVVDTLSRERAAERGFSPGFFWLAVAVRGGKVLCRLWHG